MPVPLVPVALWCAPGCLLRKYRALSTTVAQHLSTALVCSPCPFSQRQNRVSPCSTAHGSTVPGVSHREPLICDRMAIRLLSLSGSSGEEAPAQDVACLSPLSGVPPPLRAVECLCKHCLHLGPRSKGRTSDPLVRSSGYFQTLTGPCSSTVLVPDQSAALELRG